MDDPGAATRRRLAPAGTGNPLVLAQRRPVAGHLGQRFRLRHRRRPSCPAPGGRPAGHGPGGGGRRRRRANGAGVPADLARRIALLPLLPPATDLVRMAAATGTALDAVAARYFAVGERFGLAWLRAQAETIAAPGHWARLALAAIIDELYEHQRLLAEGVAATDGTTPDAAIAAWMAKRPQAVERTKALLAELRAAASIDLPMLAVASRQFRTLTES